MEIKSVLNLIIEYFETKLNEYKDPERAKKMTAYLKDIQPHLGVHTPVRRQIYQEFKKGLGKEIKQKIEPSEVQQLIDTMWNRPEREYRYVTLFLVGFLMELTIDQIPLLKKLIIEGGWWDTTDSIAIDFVSKILRENKSDMTPIMREWCEDNNLWVRRTAILSQLYFKDEMDEKLLEYVIGKTMHENEFFIQKAIGWALREYSKTNPKYVSNYTEKHEDHLSKLSIREGRKHLGKLVKSKS